jgi:hypothetical protein
VDPPGGLVGVSWNAAAMFGHRPPRRVFLSYTSELRQFPPDRSFVAAAESAIKRAGDVAVSMDNFPVRDQPVAAMCEAEVRKSEVFVLLAGFQYGSSVRGRRMSHTELEFRTATAAGIQRLVFVLDESADLAAMFPGRRDSRQDRFRAELRDSIAFGPVRDPHDLEVKLLHALEQRPSAKDVDAARTEALTVVARPAAPPRPTRGRGGRLLLTTGLLALLVAVVVGISLATSNQPRVPVAPAAAASTRAAPATEVAATESAIAVETNSALDALPSPAGEVAAKPIVDGEVTIPRLSATDVDKVPVVVSGPAVGPVGDLDLYQGGNAFRVHTGSIFPISTPGSNAPVRTYAICADYAGPSPSRNTAVANLVIRPNVPFCFVTSAHRLAWAEVVAADDDTQAVIVHVRVWDKIVEA